MSTVAVSAAAGGDLTGNYLCHYDGDEEELVIEKPGEHYRMMFQSDEWIIADGKEHQVEDGTYKAYTNNKGEIVLKTHSQNDFGTADGVFTFKSISETELDVHLKGEYKSAFGNETIELTYNCQKF